MTAATLRAHTARLLLMLVPGMLACRDATAPERLPDADLRGSWALTRAAAGFCFIPPSADVGRSSLELGLLTFDVDGSTVAQHEVRPSCDAGRDTILVDQARPFRVIGPGVILDPRDATSSTGPDTGAVSGNVLALRVRGVDLVYERVTTRDDLHYFHTSDDPGRWTVGTSVFTTPAFDNVWVLELPGTTLNQGQTLYVYRPAGLPAVGTYPIGAFGASPFYASLARVQPYGYGGFNSVSGTITITESIPTHLSGSYSIDLRDGNGVTIRTEGRFHSILVN